MVNRILVVDDDVVNLKFAEYILKSAGHWVQTAKSGMEALLFLKDNRVDLVILDIEMPIMNGIKTFEIMRKNNTTSEIPVIFLTASAEHGTVLEAARLGVNDYVTKPFQAEDLLKRVDKVLGEAHEKH